MCCGDFQLHRLTGLDNQEVTSDVDQKSEDGRVNPFLPAIIVCFLSHVGKDIALQLLLILTENKWEL